MGDKGAKKVQGKGQKQNTKKVVGAKAKQGGKPAKASMK